MARSHRPLLVLLLLVLVGCQASPGPARPAGPLVVGGVFSIDSPVPWAFESVESPTLIIWTQEPGGYLSQLSFVTGIPPGGHYAPFRDAPAFYPEMTPRDIADMTLASHVQHGGHMEARIDEVAEASFAGQPGFRFAYSYLTRNNHRVAAVYRGRLVGDRLYMIGYTARAELGDAGWSDAEHIMASARLLAPR